MPSNSDYFDCTPTNSNTIVNVDDRKLLQDITGIFNFLASIVISLMAIFGLKQMLSNYEKINITKIHVICILLLICVSFIIFFYGLFGGGTGYSIFGLTNIGIPIIYITITMMNDSNFIQKITPTSSISDIIKTIYIPFGVCLAIGFTIFFSLYYSLKNKKHKKVKKNKSFLPIMIILIIFSSLLVSGLFGYVS
jgi:hypothetical protein